MKPRAFKMVLYTSDDQVYIKEREYQNKTGMLASYRLRVRKAKQELKADAWVVYEDGTTEQIMNKEAA